MKSYIVQLATALMISHALWIHAEEPAGALSLRILQANLVQNGSVQVLVLPNDANSKALSGLSSANFQVKVDGRGQKLLSLARASEAGKPLSIVLAVDVSASMQGEGIRSVVKGASALLDSLGKGDLCSLIVFGTSIRQVSEFTDDHERIRTALAGLNATDRQTHLYQALFDALDKADAAPTSRAAVVALTDGKDDGSALGIQEIVAKAAIKDVPIYTMVYGARADLETMRRIATVSRGTFYAAPRPEDVVRAYGDIAEQLQSNYLISFALPARPRVPFKLEVDLDYRGKSAATNLTITPLPPVERKDAEQDMQRQDSSHAIYWILGGILILLLGGCAWQYLRCRRRKTPNMAATMVPPRVWLEVVKGADTGQKLLLDKEAFIGRDAHKCQIVLKNDPMVGRMHARLSQNSQGRFLLEDTGSQNGVTVNGIRISDPVVLQTDDRIVVGLSELLFIDHR
jgi:VWFA-related protein